MELKTLQLLKENKQRPHNAPYGKQKATKYSAPAIKTNHQNSTIANDGHNILKTYKKPFKTKREWGASRKQLEQAYRPITKEKTDKIIFSLNRQI